MSAPEVPMKRRCALCTAILARPAPPWAPPGDWGMCSGCFDARPYATACALGRFLTVQVRGGSYIVRSRMSRSYAADARPADYTRAMRALETR